MKLPGMMYLTLVWEFIYFPYTVISFYYSICVIPDLIVTEQRTDKIFFSFLSLSPLFLWLCFSLSLQPCFTYWLFSWTAVWPSSLHEAILWTLFFLSSSRTYKRYPRGPEKQCNARTRAHHCCLQQSGKFVFFFHTFLYFLICLNSLQKSLI